MDDDQGELAVEASRGTGFFGKLPSHGDFIARRFPAAVRAGWERWLDHGIDASRQTLGEAWLPRFLSSPIWRFVFSAGVCGEVPLAGVLMPSVDRVGRYYPLAVAAALDELQSPAGLAAGAPDWFERIETLALGCLQDGFDFAAFDAALAAEPPPERSGLGAAMGPWIEAVCPADGPAGVLPELLGSLLESKGNRYSLWWTSAGSAGIQPCVRAYLGWPPHDEFVRLLG
jgi:type VI secretion system protein ImpM